MFYINHEKKITVNQLKGQNPNRKGESILLNTVKEQYAALTKKKECQLYK